MVGKIILKWISFKEGGDVWIIWFRTRTTGTEG
jgi:hypothetical protein